MSLYPFTNTIGLDISDSKIRFVQLKNKRAGSATIEAYGEIDVPHNLINAGEISQADTVIELIKHMFNQPIYGKVSTPFVNASLPDKKTFIKTVTIPRVPSEELAGAVGWGIEQNIPITLKDVYYDWNVLPYQKNPEKLTVMTSVAPRTLVNQYSSLIAQAGYKAIGLENESTAITRCLLNPKNPQTQSMFIIDLGRSRTNIMMFSNQAIQFSETIDISGHQMTERVATELHMSYEDAEKAKVLTGLDPRKSRGTVRSLLEPILAQLASKIEEGIYFYQHYIAPEKKIDTLLLTGSVSRMQGVPEYLSEKVHKKVIVGNPLVNINLPKKPKPQLTIDFISYTTALGLALKQFDTI